MPLPHEKQVILAHTFDEAYNWLQISGPRALRTARKNTQFDARVATSQDGQHVIRFFQRNKEYARAYKCCWGRYYNCNKTRIGMYCKALDDHISLEASE